MSEAEIAVARSGFAEVDRGKLWYEVAGQGRFPADMKARLLARRDH